MYRATPSTAKHVSLQGCFNLRDLGHYTGANAKRVKSGLIYRSDELAELSSTDISTLNRLHIKTVIDFRSLKERRKTPDILPASVGETIALPISFGDIEKEIIGKTQEELYAAMLNINKRLVIDCQDQYRQFFALLAKSECSPLLFHCTAGKDRTGLAAALLLAALGVKRQTIMHDYLLSATLIAPKFHAIASRMPHVQPLLTVHEEYLNKALDTIDQHYGGMTQFLEKTLAVNIPHLRTLYLA